MLYVSFITCTNSQRASILIPFTPTDCPGCLLLDQSYRANPHVSASAVILLTQPPSICDIVHGDGDIATTDGCEERQVVEHESNNELMEQETQSKSL